MARVKVVVGLLGLLLILVSTIWYQVLTWTNYSMTQRELFVEKPVQVLLCIGVGIIGMIGVCVFQGTRSYRSK